MDIIDNLSNASGVQPTNWVYGELALDRIVYKIEWRRMNHSHILLEDGSYAIQYTHTYTMVRCMIIYVRYEDLQQLINSVGYWEGMPQVEPMLPGTDLGFFKVSGTFAKSIGCPI